jgi:hypothetical protein
VPPRCTGVGGWAPGFQPYISAITTTLSDRCDYSQIIKVYTNADPEGQRRYSPPDVNTTEKIPVMGNPDRAKICTSHVERQNLAIRMSMRRLTRLTNAFSKKWDNLWSAYCLHFAYYNFCRIHQTLRVTPVMEAGITDRVWELAELLKYEVDLLAKFTPSVRPLTTVVLWFNLKVRLR